MESIKIELLKWLNEIKEFETPNRRQFPDLDLYMDQVMTYMDKILTPFMKNEDDKIITSSMINNYVKGKIVPAPVGKKYSKHHLSYILTICMLKQTLSISDIDQIFKSQSEKEPFVFYNDFKELNDEKLENIADEVISKVTSLNDEDIDSLNMLALELAINSTINKLIAERILYLINYKHDLEIEELRKKTIIDENIKKELENIKVDINE